MSERKRPWGKLQRKVDRVVEWIANERLTIGAVMCKTAFFRLAISQDGGQLSPLAGCGYEITCIFFGVNDKQRPTFEEHTRRVCIEYATSDEPPHILDCTI